MAHHSYNTKRKKVVHKDAKGRYVIVKGKKHYLSKNERSRNDLLYYLIKRMIPKRRAKQSQSRSKEKAKDEIVNKFIAPMASIATNVDTGKINEFMRLQKVQQETRDNEEKQIKKKEEEKKQAILNAIEEKKLERKLELNELKLEIQ